VNGYRKHFYAAVENFARRLVTKWKQLVQLTTEVTSDTEHAQATCNDLPLSSVSKEKVSASQCESKIDEQHLRSISSKHKHSHSDGSNVLSGNCIPVKYKKIGEKDGDDKTFSSQRLHTKVSTALVSTLNKGQCSEDSECSKNQLATEVSALVNASTGRQKFSIGELPLVNSAALTNDKCQRHEISRKLSSKMFQSKEKYHSNSKVAEKVSKSAACEKHTDSVGFVADRLLPESGMGLSKCETETETALSISGRKSAANTRSVTVHMHTSDRHLDFNVSGISERTHDFGHVSVNGNLEDAKTSTKSADTVDDSRCNGMTFEEMLNYFDHSSIVREKKGRERHRASKCSKVPKSTSRSGSHVATVMSKHSDTSDSVPTSKHTSHLKQTVTKRGELERSWSSQRPVVPCPDSQVVTDFESFLLLYVNFLILLLSLAFFSVL